MMKLSSTKLATSFVTVAACIGCGGGGGGTAGGNNNQALPYVAELLPTGGNTLCYARSISGNLVAGEANSGALLWDLDAGTVTSLEPTGSLYSGAETVSGTIQAGDVESQDGIQHAAVWNGSASQWTNLSPSGYSDSVIFGTNGSSFVGEVSTAKVNGSIHAYYWPTTSSNGIDLNPVGALGSTARAIDNGTEVGTAGSYAAMWNGSAASVVNLNPPGYIESGCLGIRGGIEVGFAKPSAADYHAFLWRGTAKSGVDLNPVGYSGSSASATNGMIEVGSAVDDATTKPHALVWKGFAVTVFDLQRCLPSKYVGSTASSVDANGNIVGTAFDAPGNIYPVLWKPNPAAQVRSKP